MIINMRSANSIDVQGINGSTMASGVGTIQFKITDNDGVRHTIVFYNVIYLPEFIKNLISTSKCKEDKNDNCGILLRGRYFIF